jgi:hypothetical protein
VSPRLQGHHVTKLEFPVSKKRSIKYPCLGNGSVCLSLSQALSSAPMRPNVSVLSRSSGAGIPLRPYLHVASARFCPLVDSGRQKTSRRNEEKVTTFYYRRIVTPQAAMECMGEQDLLTCSLVAPFSQCGDNLPPVKVYQPSMHHDTPDGMAQMQMQTMFTSN